MLPSGPDVARTPRRRSSPRQTLDELDLLLRRSPSVTIMRTTEGILVIVEGKGNLDRIGLAPTIAEAVTKAGERIS